MVPGRWYTARVEPMDYWRARVTVTRPAAAYQMNLTFLSDQQQLSSSSSKVRHRQHSAPPSSASGSLAVYGRKGGVPSVTRHDWAHIVTGDGDEERVLGKGASGGVVGLGVEQVRACVGHETVTC